MARFICSHRLPAGVMKEHIMSMFADAAQQDDAVRGYRSFMNLSEGRLFCVVDAKDADAVRAWFDKMRMPTDEIVKVEIEGDQGQLHLL